MMSILQLTASREVNPFANISQGKTPVGYYRKSDNQVSSDFCFLLEEAL